jgi:hypothetical protein
MTNETAAGVEDTGAASGMAPAERIRALNDELRKTGAGGKIFLTSGLIAKGAEFVAKATAAVRAFDAFINDNDPWQEHDCATRRRRRAGHVQDRLLRCEHGVRLARPSGPAFDPPCADHYAGQ